MYFPLVLDSEGRYCNAEKIFDTKTEKGSGLMVSSSIGAVVGVLI